MFFKKTENCIYAILRQLQNVFKSKPISFTFDSLNSGKLFIYGAVR